MGCDGGTIPTRDELVKLKKKPEQKDSDGHRLYKWQHFAILVQFFIKCSSFVINDEVMQYQK